MVKAVLFDWGETLMTFPWDDELALEGDRAGLEALARAGLPSAEQISLWFRERAGGRERFAVDSEDEIDLVQVVRACFADLGARLSDGDVRLYLAASYAVWEPGLALAGTTHALLDALAARGLKLALVSNTAQPGWLLLPVLERQGLLERLDAVVLSSEVGKRKPHPAMFGRALSELGVAADAALFVGDRLHEDVGGARAAGMRTAQALWFRADDRDGGPEPDYQAFTQMDVLNIVDRLSEHLGRKHFPG